MSQAKKQPESVLTLARFSSKLPTTLEEANEDVLILRRNLRVCAYLLGHRLRLIKERELYRPKYASFEAYLAREQRGFSIRSAYRAIAYVNSVPAEVAAIYEPAKIDAGARLLKPNKAGEAMITRTALEALRVTAVREGREQTVPFRDATVEELVDEIARRRRRKLPAFSELLEENHDHFDRLFGTGVTRIAELRKQRQGSKTTLVITVAEDRLDDFRKLFK